MSSKAIWIGVIAFWAFIGLAEWADNNKAEELRNAAEFMRSPDTQKWADSKALADEWLQYIKRGSE